MTTFPSAVATLTVRRLATVVAAGASVLALAACGGGTSQATAQTSRSATTTGGLAQAATRTPGVSGLIAAWSNNTMQVQSATSQTAVTLTSSTRITEDKPTTAKAVSVGTCVTVRAAGTGSAASPSAQPTTAPNTSPTGPLTAATVQVRPAVNGSCDSLAAGFASGSFTPRARPSGAASGFPGRGFGGALRAFGATGQVASMTSSGFVVTENRGGTTTSVRVVTDAATTYTTIAAVTQSAVKTGECALAVGPSDSTGAVSARTLVLSQPVNGSCTTGFGFGGGARRNG